MNANESEVAAEKEEIKELARGHIGGRINWNKETVRHEGYFQALLCGSIRRMLMHNARSTTGIIITRMICFIGDG